MKETIKMLSEYKQYFPEQYKYMGDYNESMVDCNDASQLTKYGEYSLYNIAKRILNMDPSFYEPPFRLHDYYFQTTQVTRAIQSASVFAFNLFLLFFYFIFIFIFFFFFFPDFLFLKVKEAI